MRSSGIWVTFTASPRYHFVLGSSSSPAALSLRPGLFRMPAPGAPPAAGRLITPLAAPLAFAFALGLTLTLAIALMANALLGAIFSNSTVDASWRLVHDAWLLCSSSFSLAIFLSSLLDSSLLWTSLAEGRTALSASRRVFYLLLLGLLPQALQLVSHCL